MATLRSVPPLPFAAPAASDPLPYRFMISLAKRFPLTVGYAIGETIAEASYHIWGSKRRAAQRNYATVLGVDADQPEAAALARRSFRNFGRYIVEMFHLQTLRRDELQSLVSIRNLHHLKEAVDDSKGVIFVSAHIGNMEAASAALPLVSHHRVTAPGERLWPHWMMRYMERERAQWGVTLVPVERSGLRLLQALRRRKTVALVADVGIKQSGGVRARFFDRETYFPAGPARLSRMSGAPIVFGCALRDGRGFTIAIAPPMFPRHTADETADIEWITQRIVDRIEDLVRRYPEQWYMFRDMWPSEPLPARVRQRGEPAYAGSSEPGTAAS